MNFLQAHNIIKKYRPDNNISIKLAASCLIDNLNIFIQAYAAQKNFTCHIDTLAFNTLQQMILSPCNTEHKEIFLLMPWDFYPYLDWRTACPNVQLNLNDAQKHIDPHPR